MNKKQQENIESFENKIKYTLGEFDIYNPDSLYALEHLTKAYLKYVDTLVNIRLHDLKRNE